MNNKISFLFVFLILCLLFLPNVFAVEIVDESQEQGGGNAFKFCAWNKLKASQSFIPDLTKITKVELSLKSGYNSLLWNKCGVLLPNDNFSVNITKEDVDGTVVAFSDLVTICTELTTYFDWITIPLKQDLDLVPDQKYWINVYYDGQKALCINNDSSIVWDKASSDKYVDGESFTISDINPSPIDFTFRVYGESSDPKPDCYKNSDCGIDYIIKTYCSGNAVLQDKHSYQCIDPGKLEADCTEFDQTVTQQQCSSSQICENAKCKEIVCSKNNDCGIDGFIGSKFCKNEDSFQQFKTFTCNNPGTANAFCSNSLVDKLVKDCLASEQCSNGECMGACTGIEGTKCKDVKTKAYQNSDCSWSNLVTVGPNAKCISAINDFECELYFSNCDNDWTNGCEITIANDPNNCGECGEKCESNEYCTDKNCKLKDGYCYSDADCPGKTILPEMKTMCSQDETKMIWLHELQYYTCTQNQCKSNTKWEEEQTISCNPYQTVEGEMKEGICPFDPTSFLVQQCQPKKMFLYMKCIAEKAGIGVLTNAGLNVLFDPAVDFAKKTIVVSHKVSSKVSAEDYLGVGDITLDYSGNIFQKLATAYICMPTTVIGLAPPCILVTDMTISGTSKLADAHDECKNILESGDKSDKQFMVANGIFLKSADFFITLNPYKKVKYPVTTTIDWGINPLAGMMQETFIDLFTNPAWDDPLKEQLFKQAQSGDILAQTFLNTCKPEFGYTYDCEPILKSMMQVPESSFNNCNNSEYTVVEPKDNGQILVETCADNGSVSVGTLIGYQLPLVGSISEEEMKSIKQSYEEYMTVMKTQGYDGSGQIIIGNPVKLIIPPLTIKTTDKINLSEPNGWQLVDSNFIGPSYQITPNISFKDPVFLQIDYADSELFFNEELANVYSLEDWQPVETKKDITFNTIIAKLFHFSDYGFVEKFLKDNSLVDQQQSESDSSKQITKYAAQSLIVAEDGGLTKVLLAFKKKPLTGKINLEIRKSVNGMLSDIVYASASLPINQIVLSSFVNDPIWNTFKLLVPKIVSKDEELFVYVYSDTPGLEIFLNNTSTYTAGKAVIDGVIFEEADLAFAAFIDNKIVSEVCNNGIDDDGDGFVDSKDSDCKGQSCGIEKVVVWSYVPGEDKTKPPVRIGCCEQTQCINFSGKCIDFDADYKDTWVCGNENNWLKCDSKNIGAKSDGGLFVCTEKGWMKGNCAADAQCPQDNSCVNNLCTLKTGCQYNNPACAAEQECVSNTCVLKKGCAFNNPSCTVNEDCLNNQCILKTGCQYNNPSCKENEDCKDNTCVLKQGCLYNNPSCGKDYDCKNNECTLKQGCTYNNPSCGSDSDCIENKCVLKKGCNYNNPSCSENENCVNNVCVLKAGCSYNNPACNAGFKCVNNACVGFCEKTVKCDEQKVVQVNEDCSKTVLETCSGKSVCDVGSCKPVACFKNSDCGTDAFTGASFCSTNADKVLLKFVSYTCVNPGTPNASCSPKKEDKTVEQCDTNKEECIADNCVLKKGCAYDNPKCESNEEECINNECKLKQGCAYSNPKCKSSEECIDNVCVVKQGCTYNNPVCGENYDCKNNECVLKTGCEYNNPSCSNGFQCIDNICVKVACYSDADCGKIEWSNDGQVCKQEEKALYKTKLVPVCLNAGTVQSSCSVNKSLEQYTSCIFGCSANNCLTASEMKKIMELNYSKLKYFKDDANYHSCTDFDGEDIHKASNVYYSVQVGEKNSSGWITLEYKKAYDLCTNYDSSLVYEAICLPNNKGSFKLMHCLDGEKCSEGACVKEISNQKRDQNSSSSPEKEQRKENSKKRQRR